ncbi:MAG: CHAT domain-containing protein [Cytophagales bacterium]|nr:CHAT domain-containing protein [Cytophagales bacterium]
MEATKIERRRWLMVLWVYSLCIFLSYGSTASSDPPEAGYKQLLDSAEILKLKGQYHKALDICRHASIVLEKTGNWNVYVAFQAELGDTYRYLNDFGESLNILRRTSKISKIHLPENHKVNARILMYTGMLYSKIIEKDDEHKIDSVFSLYDRAEEIMNHYPDEFTLKSLVSLRRGEFCNSINRIEAAEKYFNNSLEILENTNDELQYQRGVILRKTGQFYRSLGDYERAILSMNLAHYIFSHPKNNDLSNALRCESSLANYYYYNDQLDLALEYYNKVITNAKKSNALVPGNIRSAYMNRSQPLIYMGKYDEAIQNAMNAIHLNPKRSRYDSAVLYFTYNNLAEAYALKEDFENAEKYYIESLELRIKVHGLKNSHEHVYDGFTYIGDFKERMGELLQALDYYQLALRELFPDFDVNDIYQNPDFQSFENKDWLLYVIFYKSRTLYKLYLERGNLQDLQASFQLFVDGYDVLNELMDSGNTDESLLDIYQRFKDEFNTSVDCALKLFQISGDQKFFNQAFKFVENNKYFLLYEALKNSQNKFMKGIPDSINYKQRQLNKEIIILNRILDDSIPSDSAFAIRNMLIRKHNRKADLEKMIDRVGSSSTDVLENETLDVSVVQNSLLKDGESIVEFHWSNTTINVLIFGKKFNKAVKIKKTQELEGNINTYLRIISGLPGDSGSSESEFHKFCNASSFLYEHLFEPVISTISKHTDSTERIGRVIIVPDRKISYMPFESLLTDYPDTTITSYWGLPYLFKDYVISYAYSLNILKNNLTSKKDINKPKLLGFSFSAPAGTNDDPAVLRSENELPYSSEELDRIKNWIKGAKLFKDEQATEDVFKSEAPAYSILHLALHGVADTTDIFESKLNFKKNEKSFEDGELHAFELYDMNLSKTELAVLSACETGIGHQAEGEGIFSIARGFAYAGCPSIVMSLWRVNDKATAELMDYFYKYLALDMKKDVALQQAKISYMEKTDDFGAHPSNWAAFIALGNNAPIQIPGASVNAWQFIFIILFAFVVFLIFQRKLLK